MYIAGKYIYLDILGYTPRIVNYKLYSNNLNLFYGNNYV